ncbi:MAG: serine/threonine-protein kinase [Cyanobacteria bacterium P01_E01_bin.42]
MNSLDFASYGYEIRQQLGANPFGGCITYLAKQLASQTSVVLKQFQFACQGANWSDYRAYETEIRILQRLEHPSIPRFCDAFATETGFCVVQEYKQAQPLHLYRSLTLGEIEQIAIALLEILVYLQSQWPIVIHRDIKPENILVKEKDGKFEVYLVDFGFARSGGEALAASSMVKGTLGFMPPEQIFGRSLTEASDLYGVGATLICLLIGVKSTEIGELMDERSKCLRFQHRLPQGLNPRFVTWLERMVAPRKRDRFVNGLAALAALQGIKVRRGGILGWRLAYRLWRRKEAISLGMMAIASLVPIVALMMPERPKADRLRGSDAIEQVAYLSNVERNKYLAKERLLKTKACPSCNLAGMDLSYANLKKANLKNANLQGANLTGARLQGANLKLANLNRARLRSAILSGANLQNAQLKEAQLVRANLTKVDLRRADLRFADLSNSQLDAAILGETNMRNTTLVEASLKLAEIYDTNLAYSNLERADLYRAKLVYYTGLWHVNLKNANLEHIYIDNTYIDGANMEGANLKNAALEPLQGFSEVNLKNANLLGASIHWINSLDKEAKSLQGAIMPDGSKHE